MSNHPEDVIDATVNGRAFWRLQPADGFTIEYLKRMLDEGEFELRLGTGPIFQDGTIIGCYEQIDADDIVVDPLFDDD